MRGVGHHRHAAQTYDLGRQGRRPFWQAGLRLCAEDDVYLCPAGERLTYRFTSEEAEKSRPSGGRAIHYAAAG